MAPSSVMSNHSLNSIKSTPKPTTPIPPNEKWYDEFDPEPATNSDCRQYVNWRTDYYEYYLATSRDIGLQDMYTEDFQDWSEDQLQKAGRDALNRLRITLRNGGVFVRREQRLSIKKALREAIDNPQDWPAEQPVGTVTTQDYSAPPDIKEETPILQPHAQPTGLSNPNRQPELPNPPQVTESNPQSTVSPDSRPTPDPRSSPDPRPTPEPSVRTPIELTAPEAQPRQIPVEIKVQTRQISIETNFRDQNN